MKKIALLTCQDIPQLFDIDNAYDDRPLVQLLRQQHAIIAEAAIWNDTTIDWTQYNAVVIRSPWDYMYQFVAFSQWLDQLPIPIFNPADIIRYNIHKFYLRDFEQQDIPIVPTVFVAQNTPCDLLQIATERQWQHLIIKPAISGGAHHTYQFHIDQISHYQVLLNQLLLDNDMLIQAFLPEIMSHGEWSLIYFNRHFSHAVLKTARKGDFRIQPKFGGRIQSLSPPEHLLAIANHIISKQTDLLYARVDLVDTATSPLLMELELIEPHLFTFQTHEQANFARAIAQTIDQ